MACRGTKSLSDCLRLSSTLIDWLIDWAIDWLKKGYNFANTALVLISVALRLRNENLFLHRCVAVSVLEPVDCVCFERRCQRIVLLNYSQQLTPPGESDLNVTVALCRQHAMSSSDNDDDDVVSSSWSTAPTRASTCGEYDHTGRHLTDQTGRHSADQTVIRSPSPDCVVDDDDASELFITLYD